jgi:hypothetical protein
MTTITPELEAMAKAVDPEAFKPWAFEDQPELADETDPGWQILRNSKDRAQTRAIDAARAALLAIRDIADATVAAALPANTCALPDGKTITVAVEPVWEAVIDAILGEP